MDLEAEIKEKRLSLKKLSTQKVLIKIMSQLVLLI